MSNVVHWRTGRTLEDEKAHWERVERGIEVYHAFEPILKRLQAADYDRHIIAEKLRLIAEKVEMGFRVVP